jgi:hypothetical protein
MNIRKVFKFVPAVLALLLFSLPAHAQAFVSQPAAVNLTYNVSEILTVTPSVNSLALTQTQQTISINTAWSVLSTRTQLGVIAYVSSSTPLTGSSGSVNASDLFFEGSDGEGPCTQSSSSMSGYPGPSVGANACGYVLTGNPTTAGLGGGNPGSRSANVQLRINPAANYAPGTYSGTIFFIAAVS